MWVPPHIAGVPLEINKLVGSLKFNDDPQQILQSVEAEYTHISENLITGLHWVRSNHLSDLLHDKYPDKIQTFLGLFPLVPKEVISVFVSNVISILGRNSTKFIESLAEIANKTNLEELVACLDGIFRGGEQCFFINNRNVFDNIYRTKGDSGIMFIIAELSPSLKLDILNRLDKINGVFRESVKEYRTALSQINKHARGIDYVRVFLNKISDQISIASLQIPNKETGKLFDWCFFAGIIISEWQNAKMKNIAFEKALELEIDDFGLWGLGLYRYDKACYREWLKKERDNILGYLMLQLELTSLELDKDRIKIHFLADPEIDGNEQAVNRLNALRSALPFCKQYCSSGIWMTPLGLKPYVDNTHKEMPAENLHFEIDVQKNVIFREIVENAYRPETYFEFQSLWFDKRNTALELIKLLTLWLQKHLEGRKQPRQFTDKIKSLLFELGDCYSMLPSPPVQSSGRVKQLFDSNNAKSWALHLDIFIRQLFEYLLSPKDKMTHIRFS